MNRVAEHLYFNSPVFLQNILVSLYGYKLYRERYANNSACYLEELKLSERFSSDEMHAYQESRFIELAHHAIRTVPYYRDWARRECLGVDDFTSLEDLGLFPLLGKQQLRESPYEFVSDEYKSGALIELNTSGTSGTPLRVFTDNRSRTLHYAFFSRLRAWFGLSARSRRATLFGRIIMLPNQNRAPFWRYDFAQRNLLMSSYHLSEENIPYYYRKLCDYRPEEIIAYPSSLYRIALYMLKQGLPRLSLKVIFTTAETLLQYQREAIERAFIAPVIDQYGCTEMAFFASQCEHGSMHFHPEHGIAETIGNIDPADRSGAGSLVVTGLVNRAMPLIRYEVGDRVAIDQSIACGCGRAFPVISELEGRIDDTLYRRDGTPVGRLDPVFKGGDQIVEARIVQEASGDVEVLVKPGPGFQSENKIWLKRELEKRMGEGIVIEITEVTELPKQKNGKFKAVEGHFNYVGK